MIERDATFSEIVPRTCSVKSFRFPFTESESFKPGQYFFVTISVDGTDQKKPLSFSSSPTEKGYIEFTKRITESPFSKTLDATKPGGGARIRMPFGTFTFEGEYEKIALLSGGVGITPLRSICKNATDRKLRTDIVLLYGNNTQEDIIFRQDFDEMQRVNRNLRVVHTLTCPDASGSSWKGRTGYIDAAMVKEEIPDYRERVFFLCGPPKMVEALRSLLQDTLAVAKDKIRNENFAGY